MTLRAFALLVVLAGNADAADQVRIAVLGLFHPQQITLESRQVMQFKADGREFVVRPGERAIVLRSGSRLVLRIGDLRADAPELMMTARDSGPVDFVLGVPGKLRRAYQGRLTVTGGRELVPVVQMEVETAVASIVAAELPADTPLEALKAQAIVSRSYLIAARPSHAHADFCDTTHCQFLRRPPAPGSSAARAAEETRGLVLAWQTRPLAAMFSGSCGGRTHSLHEAGLKVRDYPFFAVECPYCRSSPQRWTAAVSHETARALASRSEGERINTARKLGWSTVPSTTFVAKNTGEEVELRGVGRGHGIGLCQLGAAAMARQGKEFREILAHYFPNTTLESLPAH